jgi:hypothetical protein
MLHESHLDGKLLKDSKLDLTCYAIKNYADIHHLKNWWRIKDNQYHRANKKTPSIKILKKLMEFKYFTPITQCDHEILSTICYKEKLDDYTDLLYEPKLCCREVCASSYQQKYDHVIYSDFETDITQKKHVQYMVCSCFYRYNKLYYKTFEGENCANEYLNWLPDNCLVYFHNLKYDSSFFVNSDVSRTFDDIRVMKRGSTVLQLTFIKRTEGEIGMKRLCFRDSFSLIPAPLRAFAPMFNLDVAKDVCPYRVYNPENRKKRWVLADECIACLDNPEDAPLFIKNCHSLHITRPNQENYLLEEIDIMAYAKHYCLLDVQVLASGMRKFDNDLKQVFADNEVKWKGIDQFVSISSIGYHFALEYGCFVGCYQLAGKPQNFILRTINGGRTMTARNCKQYVLNDIEDFDAVSLYPSAMTRVKGIALGIPKVIPPTTFFKPDMYDDYFVEISIDKIPKKYDFPLVWKRIDNKKVYCDEPNESYYLDKTGLEDLIRFYPGIQWTFKRGYYFDEGFNTKINEFIRKLFELRKKYKEMKNPLEATIKLLLNSIYGKSILKPIDVETKIVPAEKLERFVVNHYNACREICQHSNGKVAYVDLIKPINFHFNLPQFGSVVLSMSKRIMNEVMCLAQHEKVPIFYQDTDSIHLPQKCVPVLADAFKKAYGRELIGKDLGQFHCDFAPIDNEPTWSIKLIALGKKSYLDVLRNKSGKMQYHIRMKGIPTSVIYKHCEMNNWTVEELYEWMYQGNLVEFDMLEGAKCFRKTKTFEYFTPENFKRKVVFK